MPVEISTDGIRNVSQFVGAIKKKLSPLLDNVAVSQLTVSLPVGIARADSRLNEEGFLDIKGDDSILHPGCLLSELGDIGTDDRHPLVIKVIEPSDEEVGRYHTSSSY